MQVGHRAVPWPLGGGLLSQAVVDFTGRHSTYNSSKALSSHTAMKFNRVTKQACCDTLFRVSLVFAVTESHSLARLVCGDGLVYLQSTIHNLGKH